MTVWALADLHLSFGVPDKEMDIFGGQWHGWTKKIEEHWRDLVQEEDLVLVAGDISWAMSPEKAFPDLDWIHQLPGTKVIVRGNHDYWWTSLNKVYQVLPNSIHLIQNNTYNWDDITIGGARLWDTPEFHFDAYIDYVENPRSKKLTEVDRDEKKVEKIYQRELQRLEMSLKGLNPDAKYRIAMTHYPPVSADLQDSRAAAILEKYHVDVCVFGHLHNVKQDVPMFGNKNGIRYVLSSCDYLNFKPIKLFEASNSR